MRRQSAPRATRGWFRDGIQNELKYWDFDCGAWNISTALDGYNQNGSMGCLPCVLTNYPTATLQGTNVTNTGSNCGIWLINNVPSGTDINTRIGRKISMKNLQLRCTVFAPTNSDWAPDAAGPPATVNTGTKCTGVRVMLIYDSQANGIGNTTINGLTLQQILNVGAAQQTAFAVGQSGYMIGMLNLDNRNRFSIISDKTFDINNVNGPGCRTLKIFKKFKKGGLPVIYSGNAAQTATTTINTGAIYLVIGGSNANTYGTYPSLAQTTNINYLHFTASRIRFTDS